VEIQSAGVDEILTAAAPTRTTQCEPFNGVFNIRARQGQTPPADIRLSRL
jgi:hypothetical protein